MLTCFCSHLFAVACFLGMEAEAANAEWSLSLQLDKKVIIPYEPVHVVVTLRNISKSPIRLPRSHLSRVVFYSSSERGGGTSDAFRATEPYCSFGEEAPVTPDESIISDQILYLGRRENDHERFFVFARAGTYEIKARLNLSGAAVESDPVRIAVKALPGNEEAAAKRISGLSLARMIQEGESSEEAVTLAKSMIRDYPKSAYTDYVRYSLASYLSVRFVTMRDGASSAIEAFQLLSVISTSAKRFNLRALYYRAEIALLCDNVGKSINRDALSRELQQSSSELEAIGLGLAGARVACQLRKPSQ